MNFLLLFGFKSTRILLFLLINFLGISSASATACRVQVFEKLDNAPHYLIALYDIHRSDSVNEKQVQSLLNFIRSIGVDKVALIAEDLGYYQGPCAEVYDALPYMLNNDKPSFLSGLLYQAHQEGIRIYNCEYRHLLTVAVNPFLNDQIYTFLQKCLDNEPLWWKRIYLKIKLWWKCPRIPSCKVSPCQIAQSFKDTLEEIKGYSTASESVMRFYKHVIDSWEKNYLSIIENFTIHHEPLDEFIKHSIPCDRWFSYANALVGMSCPLVDVKLVNGILAHQEYPVIIVCAGGAHIVQSIKVLQSIGYTLIDEINDNPHLQELVSMVIHNEQWKAADFTALEKNSVSIAQAFKDASYTAEPVRLSDFLDRIKGKISL